MRCPSCGTENREGRKFCVECGTRLALACPHCAQPYEPGERFCGECGGRLDAALPQPEMQGDEHPHPTERRLVSVLFADLVGFTPLSEHRDPEEVRELLSRYFDVARQVVERYGGVIEKFIGDAIMAVWGSPVAREDDVERAVRAGLDLVAAVSTLAAALRVPDLRARAGVMTGEAAVTVGATNQGMVAGDLVNTASRVQAVAAPGTVLVGERTRRASEAAVAYEEAGFHELKGKAEPLPLWRALRVIAARRGLGRSGRLEAPFVGRDGEFGLLKDLFHATESERKARLVSVVGVAGIGKSRLAWEFEKYLDGLVENVWWHRGRSLSYGEGISFWALADMVRMRANIAEQEEPETAREKLRDTVALHVPDPADRAWVEPRLAQLLGLEQGGGDQQDLFGAWRFFFERLADQHATVLVFEDLHWADAGLIDFVDYLLDGSRGYPLYIVTLSRPELAEQRPDWGAGKRSFTSIFLEPLTAGAMDDLLHGLVPGLDERFRGAIRDRSDGIPLYAVETVRMLIDRGALREEDGVYRTDSIDVLEVPETLHALIASRLDNLDPNERSALQDAAVLGKAFRKEALAAVSGLTDDEAETLLTSLQRKEILAFQADPRSPERGQYSFLQSLFQKVAYDTLGRRDRKERHLAVARHLEQTWGAEEDEIVEVLASHYLEAYAADPNAEDATALKAEAKERLVRAGTHAASLAASVQAQRYFDRAAELAETPLERARLRERAGETAFLGGRNEEAAESLREAFEIFEAEGGTTEAGRASARLAEALWQQGEIEPAIELMERAFEVLSGVERDANLAALAAQLGRFLLIVGEAERAAERLEYALETAEELRLPEVVAEALNTKAMLIIPRRPQEGRALIERSLALALEHDLVGPALRAYNNLVYTKLVFAEYAEAIELVEAGLALARKRGGRVWEWALLTNLCEALALSDRWDDALAAFSQVPPEAAAHGLSPVVALPAFTKISIARGDLAAARETLERFAQAHGSADLQEQAAHAIGRAFLARAEGRYADALADAREGVQAAHSAGIGGDFADDAWVEAIEAGLALGDLDAVRQLLGELDAKPRGHVNRYLEAQVARLKARLAQCTGDRDTVEPGYERAAKLMREIDVRFALGVCLLEHGEFRLAEGRSEDAAALVDEARAIFEQLRATPWLERAERALALEQPAPTPVSAR